MPDIRREDQTLTPLVRSAFGKDNSKYKWFMEWSSLNKNYRDPKEDDKKLIAVLYDQSRSHEANIFLVLAIARNFSAHVFNDESELFLDKNYEKAFLMCIEALMYILVNIRA